MATTRGKRALKGAEDEDESIDLDIGKELDDDQMEEDEETFAATLAPRATRSARAPKKPASKATPKSSKTTKTKVVTARKGKGKSKQPALFLSDPSDEDEGEGDDTGAADFFDGSDGGDSALVSELVGDDREAAMTSTLRSTAGTQVRRTAARAAKKRPVALVDLDDGDSDDDAVFKGFGGRKRGRTG